MNYIDVNELVISSQDADNTYIAVNEYGDIVRTKIAAGGGEGGYVDLSDYYTKSEVDKKIENIDTSEVDLSNYYTKQEINNKGFVTDSDVNDYVGNEIAQLEEIINTKQNQLVSGSNIKTVNGMSLLGSGNINIESGYVDWNAKEGEAGYIENRTHYVDLTYFKHLTINKNDFDLSFDGSYWIAEYNTLLNEDQLFVYCSAAGKEFYSPIGNSEIQLPNYMYVKTIDVFADYGDFVGRKLVVRNGAIDEEFRGESFYIADIWSYPHIKELSSIYLPNTVLKTTPQSLSDTDKNQARANLGISTPNWNAQEGEAGYIENRTHYIERRFLTNVKINPIEWEITYDDTDEYREFGIARLKESLSPFDDYFIVVDCIDEDDNNNEHYKEVVLKLSNEWQYVEQGNELFWEIKIDNTYDEVSGDGGLYLMVRDIYGNNITNIEFAYCDEFNFYIKKIDEHYLPNTLLKTSDLSLYYTKTEIDGLIGDINNILESI